MIFKRERGGGRLERLREMGGGGREREGRREERERDGAGGCVGAEM